MSISKAQFKSILQDYRYTRTKNELLLEERKEKLYKNIPSLKSIDERIATISLDFSKLIFSSPSNRQQLVIDLKNQINKLKKEKVQQIEENGFAATYLDPIFTCEDCKDTGYIDNHKCHCFKKAIIDIAYNQSNLTDVLSVENFSTFSLDYYSKEMDKIYRISPYKQMEGVYKECFKFTSDFDMIYSNLILYGNSGLGKTFLCNCIAKSLLDSSHSVIYLTAFQLFRKFETYRFNNKEDIISYDEIDDLYTCDLIIIDDLGSEIINSFTSSELFNLLNTRMLNKKSTVISTNLKPPEWSTHYSNRIVSRIFGNYKPLLFIGDDIRMKRYS